MKSNTKRMGVALTAAALAATAVAGAALAINSRTATAYGDQTAGYFYEKLQGDERAVKFYDAFAKLEEDGEFKKGAVQPYDLVEGGIATEGEVARFISNGENIIPFAYGAGRDSFYMDNPDLFYIDVYGTSLSAGQMGGKSVAYLDSSRSDTLYLGDLDSESKINSAIQTYENKLNAIVTQAKQAGGVKEQIEYVNDYIAENVTYSFGTAVQNGRNVDLPEAAYISTAYGSLVNGKAICGGFAKGFKAVMDRLQIPCVCVQGYAADNGETMQPHMWNYVQLDDDMWYAVDPTYNATGTADKWLFLGANSMEGSHVEDKVVSSSGFELSYPALKPYDYGEDADDNGMTINGKYAEDPGYGRTLTLTVSYENKSAQQLQQEGKYLAMRYGTDGEAGEITWAQWFNILLGDEVMAGLATFNATDTQVYIFPGTQYVQFALIDYASDDDVGGATYPASDPENAGKPCYYAYKAENLTDNHFVTPPSAPYENEGYESYVSAPWGNPNPANAADLPVDKTYNIRITYTETLERTGDGEPSMTFTASKGDATVREKAVLTDFNWDGDKVISFTFTPSKMYEHNLATYYFVPTNLVGKSSKKVPSPVTYSFTGKSVICSKVFNDGRLYMSVFGEPKMLDTSDLSVTDFKDENGNYYAASQRSQLLLVASKVTGEEEQELEGILTGNNTNLEKDDIVASSTYEIDLSICGVVRQVPNGSYMQVAFGFPEGYSPDDKGTTFKIYHYEHDDSGNITGVTEIPVIITEYGLIAKVTSFSPFTIVQVKNTSAAVTQSSAKYIYASVNGKGGSIKTADGEGGIVQVKDGGVTYNITADAGYQVASVYLNGELLKGKDYEGGTLTVKEDDLKSDNLLEVSFITSAAAQTYADKKVTLHTSYGFAPVGDLSGAESAPKKSNKGVIIAICVVVAVAVVAAGAVAIILVLRKKKATAGATAKKKTAASAKAKTSTKTAAKAKTSTKTAATAKTSTAAQTAKSATKTATTAQTTKTAPKTSGIAGSAANKTSTPAVKPAQTAAKAPATKAQSKPAAQTQSKTQSKSAAKSTDKKSK